MALLTIGTPTKGVNNSFTLDCAALAALPTDAYFQVIDNWLKVVAVYKSADGNQHENVVFQVPDGTLSGVTGHFKVSTKARDDFELSSIIIYDEDGGSYSLVRADIPDAATFDIAFGGGGGGGGNPMLMTFDNAYGQDLTLNFGDVYSVTVNWGDGNTISYSNGTPVSHTYDGLPAVFPVSITGTATEFHGFPNGAPGITDVSSWGDFAFTNLSGAFSNCSYLTTVPVALPLGVTNLSSMFSYASIFDGDLSAWDTSSVTNMSSTFYQAVAFNQDISGWNTASVTSMANMFTGAFAFNQDISGWNTANVTNMSGVFASAYLFNQPIGGWNTSNVTDMSNMFMFAFAFNQPLNGWDVSKVTNMSSMFYQANHFNRALSSWNTSSVTNMNSMFNTAFAFNGDISSWVTSSVTDMGSMFSNTLIFNQDISGWNTSNVTNMSYMFSGAYAFNQDISGWDVSKVTTMASMFSSASAFNQDINVWNTSSVTDMHGMFAGASVFNQPLNGWDVSKVTNMNYMFQAATAFNMPLNMWDTSKVTDMSYMFYGATMFNKPLDTWVTTNVTSTKAMFFLATHFNGNVGSWDTSNVTDMSSMFNSASVFNQDISLWDVSLVTDMNNMFAGATMFNLPLAAWDTSSVTNMVSMFSEATHFNRPIGSWNVSNVTSMDNMFYNATAFNQPLSDWCVSNITSVPYGFSSGSALSGPNAPLWGQCPVPAIVYSWSTESIASGTPTLGDDDLLSAVLLADGSPAASGITVNVVVKQGNTVVTSFQSVTGSGGSVSYNLTVDPLMFAAGTGYSAVFRYSKAVSAPMNFTPAAVAPAYPTGAVAYWPLQGDTLDSSGNNHTLSSVGAPASFTSSGNGGQALAISGDYYLQADSGVPVIPQILNASGARSMAIWVKPTSQFSYDPSGIIGYGSNGGTAFYITGYLYGKPQWSFWGNNKDIETNATPPVGTWTHLAVTYDGGTSINLYVNGNLASSASYNVNNAYETEFTLGHTSIVGWISAHLQRAVVYDRELTSQEVSDIYANGLL